jgi:hypothetical protein
VRLPVMLAAALVLTACGTKGPLYLVGEGGQRIFRENQPGLRAPVIMPGRPAPASATGTAAPSSPTPTSPAPSNVSPADATPGSEATLPAVDVGPAVPMTIPAQ